MNRILFGSANHWTSPYQVGSHAWARLFMQHHWQVGYVSDPLTPWHWLNRKNKKQNRERFELWLKRNHPLEENKLRTFVPFSVIAPYQSLFLRNRWVLKNWHFFVCPSMETQIKGWGFESPEILWLDSVRHANWGKKSKPQFTVLRIADWNPGFRAVPAPILEMERKLLSEADLVITSAKALEERLRSFRGGRPLCTIRNGVDISFWSAPSESPPEYRHIPFPRAVYVGAFDDWFDLPLLEELARALPYVSFVMIGASDRIQSLVKDRLPNIYWLGVRPRNQVRAYLHDAQVGMIPFKRNELIECVCPLKLYEYMACGLKVVSTRWEELERMNSPARLANGTAEWIDFLREEIEKSEPLGASSQVVPANLAYVKANDWQQRWLEWQSLYNKVCKRPP